MINDLISVPFCRSRDCIQTHSPSFSHARGKGALREVEEERRRKIKEFQSRAVEIPAERSNPFSSRKKEKALAAMATSAALLYDGDDDDDDGDRRARRTPDIYYTKSFAPARASASKHTRSLSSSA